MLNEQESTKRTKIRDAMYGQFMADRDKRKRDKKKREEEIANRNNSNVSKKRRPSRRNAGGDEMRLDGSRKSSKINYQIAEEVFKEKMRIDSQMLLRKGTNSTNNKPTSEDLIEHDDDDLSEELSEDLSEDDEGFDAYD